MIEIPGPADLPIRIKAASVDRRSAHGIDLGFQRAPAENEIGLIVDDLLTEDAGLRRGGRARKLLLESVVEFGPCRLDPRQSLHRRICASTSRGSPL